MLKRLEIRHFGLVRRLDLELPQGFTAITGETGAGKSMLLGAVSAALGARVHRELLHEASPTRIACTFTLSTAGPLRTWLLAKGMTAGDVVLVRELNAGRSRFWLNEQPILQKELRSLVPELADLHGQRDLSLLLDPEHHMRLLDGMAQTLPVRRQHDEAWLAWRDALSGLKSLERQLAREEELRELRDFQLDELTRLDAQPGEDARLESEHRLLANVEELKQIAFRSAEALYDADASIHDQLSATLKDLERAARLDPALEAARQILLEAQDQIQEAATSCRSHAEQLEWDPERLALVRERLELLDRMIRKYGGTLDSLLARRHELEQASSLADDLQRELTSQGTLEKTARERLLSARKALSAARLKAGKALESGLAPLMAELGIEGGQFHVRHDAPEGDFAECGAEQPRFLVSTNPDTPLGPLEQIASGGELSRIMLAFKSLLLEGQEGQCLVFDEIDSGISGKAALAVARLMKRLASRHQLLCITHLPQIAAAAEHQIGVDKQLVKGVTQVDARLLQRGERLQHLARLQSGREGAEDLLAAERLLAAAGPAA